MLSDIAVRRRFRNDDDNDSRIGAILMVIGLILLIISPLVAKILQLAVSRRREYLADATAVQFTRNPDGLISALRKISDDDSELNVASNSNAHMYIASPFKDKKQKEKSSIFDTHPPVSARIEALENLR